MENSTIDIRQFIDLKNIIFLDSGLTKEEVIRRLVEFTFNRRPNVPWGITVGDVFNSVISREKMQSTGIGDHLAFPHARVKGWGDLSIVIGVSRQGVEFDSIDDKPVKLIFLMVSSEDQPYIVLQAMSAVIRFLKEKKILKKLVQTNFDAEAILKDLKSSGINATELILARDIMRPAGKFVKLSDSLEKATNIMHLTGTDVLPVVDDTGRFCGSISCLAIFESGLPNFFKKLNTISFVRHIDPFEKYFKIKRNLTVESLVNKATLPIKEDATLVEIIFELTVKRRDKLFVVNKEGSLAGVIDRFSVIDKILFF